MCKVFLNKAHCATNVRKNKCIQQVSQLCCFAFVIDLAFFPLLLCAEKYKRCAEPSGQLRDSVARKERRLVN